MAKIEPFEIEVVCAHCGARIWLGRFFFREALAMSEVGIPRRVDDLGWEELPGEELAPVIASVLADIEAIKDKLGTAHGYDAVSEAVSKLLKIAHYCRQDGVKICRNYG